MPILYSNQKGAVALTAKITQKTATGSPQKPSFVVKYNYGKKHFTRKVYINRGCISTSTTHGCWHINPGGRFGEVAQHSNWILVNCMLRTPGWGESRHHPKVYLKYWYMDT